MSKMMTTCSFCKAVVSYVCYEVVAGSVEWFCDPRWQAQQNKPICRQQWFQQRSEAHDADTKRAATA